MKNGAAAVDLEIFSMAITGDAGIKKGGAGSMQMTGVGVNSYNWHDQSLRGLPAAYEE